MARRFRGEKLRLVVQPPSAQDLAAVELTADRQEVYPTQPFTVTLSVFVKELPAPLSDRDPLSVQKTAARAADSLARGSGPAGRAVAQGGLADNGQSRISSIREGVGFGINDLACSRRHFLLRREQCHRLPAAARDRRPAATQKDRRPSIAATTSRGPLRPSRSARLPLGAVTLQGTFAYEASETGQIRGKEIYAASKPLAILVKDVPRSGRPENYIGAIGHFRLAAELTPRKSKVGDPITFTLVLSGTGSLAAVKPPDLSKSPAVAGRFKVYEATQKTDVGYGQVRLLAPAVARR